MMDGRNCESGKSHHGNIKSPISSTMPSKAMNSDFSAPIACWSSSFLSTRAVCNAFFVICKVCAVFTAIDAGVKSISSYGKIYVW
jgi:hypothetical protein